MAFEKVLIQAVERAETRLLAYGLMPNHWHVVVWPLLVAVTPAVCFFAG